MASPEKQARPNTFMYSFFVELDLSCALELHFGFSFLTYLKTRAIS